MTHAVTAADVALMRTGRWFSQLAPDVAQALLDIAVVTHLGAGGRVFSRGDPQDGLYVVLGGALCIGGVSAQGREALVALVEAPHWIGEVSLLDDGVRTQDVWAETDARLARVPLAPLLRLLDRRPAIWRDIGRLAMHKLRVALDLLEAAALDQPRQRLARRLLALADGHGQLRDGRRARVRISQERLATLVSASRQTVNELLGEFEREGLVRRLRGAIELVDLERLAALHASSAAG